MPCNRLILNAFYLLQTHRTRVTFRTITALKMVTVNQTNISNNFQRIRRYDVGSIDFVPAAFGGDRLFFLLGGVLDVLSFFSHKAHTKLMFIHFFLLQLDQRSGKIHEPTTSVCVRVWFTAHFWISNFNLIDSAGERWKCNKTNDWLLGKIGRIISSSESVWFVSVGVSGNGCIRHTDKSGTFTNVTVVPSTTFHAALFSNSLPYIQSFTVSHIGAKPQIVQRNHTFGRP